MEEFPVEIISTIVRDNDLDEIYSLSITNKDLGERINSSREILQYLADKYIIPFPNTIKEAITYAGYSDEEKLLEFIRIKDLDKSIKLINNMKTEHSRVQYFLSEAVSDYMIVNFSVNNFVMNMIAKYNFYDLYNYINNNTLYYIGLNLYDSDIKYNNKSFLDIRLKNIGDTIQSDEKAKKIKMSVALSIIYNNFDYAKRLIAYFNDFEESNSLVVEVSMELYEIGGKNILKYLLKKYNDNNLYSTTICYAIRLENFDILKYMVNELDLFEIVSDMVTSSRLQIIRDDLTPDNIAECKDDLRFLFSLNPLYALDNIRLLKDYLQYAILNKDPEMVDLVYEIADKSGVRYQLT